MLGLPLVAAAALYGAFERMLVEQFEYNLLFRWFVGLALGERAWDATTFSPRSGIVCWTAIVGLAMIHQCQISEVSAGKFKALLKEFYSDLPERLKASLFGLTLVVKKPRSDQEQD